MKFLVDAQLPPALAHFLKKAGHSAVHVTDVGLKNADDSAIWDHASENHLVIVTKDEDFAERVLFSPKGPAVVWLRIGNCSNSAILQWMSPLLDDLTQKIESGERLVEVI